MERESAAEHLVDRFTEEVWNGRRLDVLDELVAGDYELHQLADGTVPIRGRDQLRAHVEEWLAAFPDLRMRETDRVAAGSRVMSAVRVAGTHTGEPYLGVPASGAAIDVALIAIFDTDGERLLRHGTLLDARGLIQQLTDAR